MKTRWLSILLLFLTTAAFAEGPAKRTIIVKDGKIITDDTEGHWENIFQHLDGDLLGGKRAHLGVRLTDIGPDLREHYGAPKDSGVLVSSVEDNSPAEKAGVKVGDVIIAVDGKDIDSSSDVRRTLRDKKEGDPVRIDVLRGRARQSLVASVVEKEGVRIISPGELPRLEGLRQFNSPEWKARIETLGDCGSLQSRIKELEARLKDLEKRLER